jgi:hypothetical protein
LRILPGRLPCWSGLWARVGLRADHVVRQFIDGRAPTGR